MSTTNDPQGGQSPHEYEQTFAGIETRDGAHCAPVQGSVGPENPLLSTLNNVIRNAEERHKAITNRPYIAAREGFRVDVSYLLLIALREALQNNEARHAHE